MDCRAYMGRFRSGDNQDCRRPLRPRFRPLLVGRPPSGAGLGAHGLQRRFLWRVSETICWGISIGMEVVQLSARCPIAVAAVGGTAVHTRLDFLERPWHFTVRFDNLAPH